tara:strand:- start:241 stop:399 length:159 start_codon:yes stop_codon:yes gene_type:complete
MELFNVLIVKGLLVNHTFSPFPPPFVHPAGQSDAEDDFENEDQYEFVVVSIV